MYLHHTWIHLQPEHRDEYVTLLVAEVRLARQQEPGIKRFDILQNLADPNLIHLVEVYTGKAAWEHHRYQPYLTEFAEKTQHCYAATPPTRFSEARNLEPLDHEWE